MRAVMRTLAPVRERIESKLRSALQPQVLRVVDESDLHEGHASKPAHGETHFRVAIVSAQFVGLSLRERHRRVYQILEQELAESVHALQLETRTPAEASDLLASK
jgi:BolA protein